VHQVTSRLALSLVLMAALAGARSADACSSDADCFSFGSKCHPGIHFCDVNGTCTTPSPLNCDDNDPCTDDSCDETAPGNGCVHTPHCGVDDGVACNGKPICVPTPFGPVIVPLCETTGPPSCDDGDACTFDACVEPTGCTHTPVNCDDGKASTVDVCDVQQGCLHFLVQSSTSTTLPDSGYRTDADCADDACIAGRHCVAGTCTLGTRKSCDDGNACTVDVCDEATGCAHVPLGGCCTTDADCPAAVDPCAPETCGVDHICEPRPRTGLDGLVCACQQPLSTGCGTIPAGVTKRRQRGCALVTQAAATPGSERKLVAQAAAQFGRAVGAAAHAKGLSAACVSSLKALLGSAHGQAQTLIDQL
jgi:hypothetical protein